MNDIFKLRKNTNNLRNVQSFETQNPRTKWYSLDCTAFIASQIWRTFFIEIQDTILLKIVKQNENLVLQFLSMLLLQTLHSPGFIQMWSLHCIFSLRGSFMPIYWNISLYVRPISMCNTFHLVWRSMLWCKWGISQSWLVLFIYYFYKEYNTVQYRCINADLKICWYIHLHITTFSFKNRNWNKEIFACQFLLCITKQLKDLAYCRHKI